MEGQSRFRKKERNRWESESDSEIEDKERENVNENKLNFETQQIHTQSVGQKLAVISNEKPSIGENTKDEIIRNTDELRSLARQKYLDKREEERFHLLEKEVSDLEGDVANYGWSNLTKKEQNDIRYKREVLHLIREKRNIDKSEGYALPEDYVTDSGRINRKRKEEVLNAKFKSNEVFKPDNEQWEQNQISVIKKSKISHPDEIVAPNQDQYDYVFDDSHNIDFVSEDIHRPEETVLDKQIKNEEARIKSIDEVRRSLPVYQYRDELLDAIREHQILIVVGETGSGKTTQLPQYLFENGYSENGKKIACTQPRRVAATSVAARVADEMGVKLGNEVGYSIRFEDNTNEKTVLKYMTDGMLLREFLSDPDLNSYSALMIDEAHERTLSTDILFGLVKDIARSRPDLRLLISSATMNAQKFSDYFDGAPVFNIPGRRFPVDIYYTKQPEANVIHAATTSVLQIHTSQGAGDILVFLTGQDEIEAMAENLQETSRKLGNRIKEMIVCPIYANLPQELQQRIFEPTPKGSRKVVLATNIAETSITIDGIVYVIDTGLVKENTYNPSTGMESLVVNPCSRASADQRAGRAGRVGPGKCFRLYTKWTYYHELQANPTPEILRTNLSSVVLLLLSLGISDLLAFDFMDPPSTETLIKSFELLYALGALKPTGGLTLVGRNMSQFPTDPMLAKVLLSSRKLHCTDEILSIIATLGEAAALFYRPKEKKSLADAAKNSFNKSSDLLTLLEIYKQWVDSGFSAQWCRDNFVQSKSLMRARNVRDQLERLCENVELMVKDKSELEETLTAQEKTINIEKAFTAGFFPNAARLSKTGESYKSLKRNQPVFIHPSSVLYKLKPPPKLLIYYELVLTSKEFMRNCLPIQEKWLTELAPHYFNAKETEEIESNRKKLPKLKN
ncbi:hypothetical protein WICMUC_003650 [Wickerhamomyces mucosus]|uniref:RNA helicase n=1 Tax=Wickerhamomyces mucosus TaxID=1378264 RepID=A0A9P8PJQ2_9ASCO|nr:hypothetical protein WICMUC_003650 [Wickerhamomyces mucosus]